MSSLNEMKVGKKYWLGVWGCGGNDLVEVVKFLSQEEIDNQFEKGFVGTVVQVKMLKEDGRLDFFAESYGSSLFCIQVPSLEDLRCV